jgi:uncharacterized protein YbjT (DUF2867 family)
LKILVAGGTGVLGRPAVRLLVERGHEVVVLARDVAKARSLLGPDVRLTPGDILDRAACEQAAIGCDAAWPGRLTRDRSCLKMNGRKQRISH